MITPHDPAFPQFDDDRPVRIVLLEDNPLDAELVLDALAGLQRPIHAERVDTRTAFVASLERGPDLILADYSLPQFNGLEALEIARVTSSDVPFIFVSGALGEERAIDSLQRGATDYVLKHRLERLPAAAARALRAVAAERERRAAERARVASERERERLYAELENTNAQLVAANRAKDEFLALISHDLRTPMTAILGWLSLLENTDDAGDRQEAIEMIRSSARLQAKLIDDLLDASRIATGKLRLVRSDVDVRRIVESAIAASRPSATEKGVRVQVEMDETASAYADANRLQQALLNLVSNAIKFTPTGGSVRVAVMAHARSIVIRVTDSGVGIPAALLPNIFDRFAQRVAGHEGGLGLGLAIVKHILELHGGSISASSDGEGKGATFEFELPREENHERGTETNLAG